jgi:hypothetical protein
MDNNKNLLIKKKTLLAKTLLPQKKSLKDGSFQSLNVHKNHETT